MQTDLQCHGIRLQSEDGVSALIESVVNHGSERYRFSCKHNSVDGVVLLFDARHITIVDANTNEVVELKTAK